MNNEQDLGRWLIHSGLIATSGGVATYPDSTTVVNAYDGPGNLALVTDQAGNQVQYTYDAAGGPYVQNK